MGAKKSAKPKKQGLYANIHAKQKRISNGSGETMHQAGDKDAPTDKSFSKAKKTVHKK